MYKSTLKIIITAIFVGFLTDVSASHLLGGDIVWVCGTGANAGKYKFTLTVYRDCTGINLGGGTQTIQSPAGGIQCAYVAAESGDVSPNCNDATYLAQHASNPAQYPLFDCTPSSGPIAKGSIEKHVWRSGWVSLNGVPPAGGWEFSWTGNARPDLENSTASNQNYYLRSKMYPYTPLGASSPLNTNNCYDNSPVFSQDANGVTCSGFRYYFNHLASDKELDSLVFDWAQPLLSATNAVGWNTGFSHTAPYPNPNVPGSSHGPITFDPNSGELSYEAINPAQGWYASCIVIKAYKCNQLVAEVYRDVAFFMRNNCPPGNTAPSAEIDTTVWKNVQRNGNVYTINTYPKDTVAFDLTSLDVDADQITFDAVGSQVPPPSLYTSGTGCNGTPPCAKITPALGQVGFVSQITNNIHFQWIPDCVHLNAGACGSPNNTYYFTLKMLDDGCPAPRVGLATVVINVIAGDPTPPPLKCVMPMPDGDVQLSWDQPELDSALDFNYYRLYGAANRTGPYSVIDSITDYNQLSTVLSGLPVPGHYYMEMSTGKCDFISRPSDTLSIMEMTLTAAPPVSSQYAQLSWTPYANPLPSSSTGVYQIWAEVPSGSSNWIKAGETTDLSYVDTVSICNGSVTYQIRVEDTSINCYSGSVLDSAIFSDLTNTDKIKIDSVSVNANNNALISWTPSPSGDIVEYELFYNDPIQGWIVVENIPAGTPMPYEWTDSRADLRSELFKIISIDSCGNQSDDQITIPVPTIYLKGNINSCEGYAQVSWTTYESFSGGAAGYRIYLSVTDPSGTTSPYTLQNVVGANDTTFRRYELETGYTYCYRVQVYDTTGQNTSTSNEFCISGDVPQGSEYLYMATVTNDADREALYIRAFVDGTADVEYYDIQRSFDRFGPWQTISTIEKPAQPPYVIDFYDFGVEPDRYDYYYRLVSGSACGGIDTVSNLGRNMLLSVSSQENMINMLNWTPYEKWENGVASYDIYRKAEEETEFSRVATISGADTFYADNIESLPVIENGNYCYYVIATEDNNSFNFVTDAGLPFTSLSNEVCMNQKVKMFMPTAFRPGSQITENRSFGPDMEFDDVSKYNFYVVNRWGTKVFESSDPTLQWDGTFNGQDAPSGVYIYYVKYATPGDKPQEERGTFTLIR